ncbi:class II aldolase/adducin family protein [Coprothermobacteraceae bacterium]|nr:class II aldolase/adducin family protein [Coprothermobacteraceae bacterium]
MALEAQVHREALSRIMSRLYNKGLISAFGGNASVKLPDGTVLITPSGLNKEELNPEDLVMISPAGAVLESEKKPSSELWTHLAVYGVRPDVTAIVHAHPPTLVGLVSGGFEFGVYTPEQVVLVGELAVLDLLVGKELAQHISKIAADHKAVLVKNHGVFCWGRSLTEAYAITEILEEVAKMVVASYAAGYLMQPLSYEQREHILTTYKPTNPSR